MLFTPIKPMLLSTGSQLIDNDKTLYDIKWDGWRILLHKKGDRIEAYTRHGNLITYKFPELQQAIHQIKSDTAILDCEGVVLRNGISVFDDFAYRGLLTTSDKIQIATETHPATFIAFDVLESSKSHIHEPLIDRKERLKEIIEPSKSIVTSPYVIGEGTHLFNVTKEKGMEGIVEKGFHSTYQVNTRSNDWKKHKHFKQMDTVIMGYKENPFALIVGVNFPDKLRAIATIEFGFKPEEKQAFRKISKQLITKQIKDMNWLEPVLCCKVQYLERTEKNHLRIASFKGFNFNLMPNECIWTSHELIVM
jgi:bifunctional non-homologous end joining protein LigD